jgi:hypothetical protein
MKVGVMKLVVALGVLSQSDAQASGSGKVTVRSCKTKSRILVIDGTWAKPRLRVWSLPQKSGAMPQVEISNGRAAMQGGGGCRPVTWTFANDKISFRIEGDAEGSCAFPDWGDMDPYTLKTVAKAGNEISLEDCAPVPFP